MISIGSSLRLLFLGLLTLSVRADIVDRIAITIDSQVITESQIDEEIRVTFFLNRDFPKWAAEQRRAAADRLIQQSLVEREMKLGHYPPPTDQEIQKYFDGIADSMGGLSSLTSALKQSRLDADVLKAHLSFQLTALRFIEYRFRPNFEIGDDEIEAYRKRQPKAPSGAVSRETLIQQRTDEILGAWLEEARKQVNIVYLDSSLQ